MKNKLNKLLEKNGTKWKNTYYESEDCIILNISKEETNENYDVLIDKEDFELVSKGQWFVNNGRKNSHLKDIYNIVWSVKKDNKNINYNIYQYILGTKNMKNCVVDHINMNRFDNRRKNLRITTPQVNSINTISKGYYFDKYSNKYLVRVKVKNKEINIGRYDTEEEALIMRIKACLLLGLDELCYNVKKTANELNIKLTEEDYNNKYIQKLLKYIKEGD